MHGVGRSTSSADFESDLSLNHCAGFFYFNDESLDQLRCGEGAGTREPLACPEGKEAGVASFCGGRTHGSGQNILQGIRKNGIFLSLELVDEGIAKTASRPA